MHTGRKRKMKRFLEGLLQYYTNETRASNLVALPHNEFHGPLSPLICMSKLLVGALQPTTKAGEHFHSLLPHNEIYHQ